MIGLEYMHMNGILHRDIKPENLVLDNRGKLSMFEYLVIAVCVELVISTCYFAILARI